VLVLVLVLVHCALCLCIVHCACALCIVLCALCFSVLCFCLVLSCLVLCMLCCLSVSFFCLHVHKAGFPDEADFVYGIVQLLFEKPTALPTSEVDKLLANMNRKTTRILFTCAGD
jgi:hypothetical protein